MDGVKRSDFDLDLRFGKAQEVYVNSLLTSPIEKVEVKGDRRWKNTGNVYIEIWCWSHNNKKWFPSGLQRTKATHWSFVLEEMVLIVPIGQLIKAVKQYGSKIECSIPPDYSKGFLVKVTDLMQVAKQ
jgi:hypothetical protein